MAKKTPEKTTPPADPAPPAAAGKPTPAVIMLWTCGALLWVLVVASVISHDPMDGPLANSSEGVLNATPANWVGPVGAWVSSELLTMLGGWTLGVLILGISAYLVLRALRRLLPGAAIRGLGLVLLALSVGVLVHTAFPSKSLAHPEQPGGLLGSFLSDFLVKRFNDLGTLLIMGGTAFVGLLLATEETVFALWKWGKTGTLKVVEHAKTPGQAEGEAPPAAEMAPAAKKPWFRWPAFMMKDSAEAKPAEPAPEPAIPAGILVPTPAAPPSPTDEKPKRRKKEEDPTDSNKAETPAAESKTESKADPDAIRKKLEGIFIQVAKPAEDKKKKPEAAAQQDLSGYRFPPLDILKPAELQDNAGREEELRNMAIDLQAAMEQYKISGEVVGIASGPVVTLFEVRLAPGTRVAKLEQVDADLARALKTTNIRIVPTIAGKDTVGVEVPNKRRQTVRIRELMEEMADAKDKMALPMFLGRDATGKPLVEDLAKAPHMLIAGTTGSGKSVCMNSILLSLLYNRRPDELKMILVDPKMVEMGIYKAIPHLLCPVITEMSKAAGILEWACAQMDERFARYNKAGVRDIKGYNALSEEELREAFQPASEEEWARTPKKMPYFVIVVDEMADLMMQFPDVESHIVRIAQKARACGMHLLMATQRPSADVVTGLIKSNMPTRLCMKVNSGLDSRVMLDKSGGEVLLGNGDMLFMFNARPELVRAQGCFIEDSEARETVKFLKDVAQQAFEPTLLQIKGPRSKDDDQNNDSASDEGNPSGERDPLFEKAVDIIVMQGRGSTTLLQTKMGVGYSRATRLIEQIADAGVLGPHKGSQAREVLLSQAEWETMKGQAAAGGDNAPASARTEGGWEQAP